MACETDAFFNRKETVPDYSKYTLKQLKDKCMKMGGQAHPGAYKLMERLAARRDHMETISFLSTHPVTAERIQRAREADSR